MRTLFLFIFIILVVLTLLCCCLGGYREEKSQRTDDFHIKTLTLTIETYIDDYGYLNLDAVEKMIHSIKPESSELREVLKGCKEYAEEKNNPESLERYCEVERLCKERGWI